jgi:glycosyltransferase involved in cell wall biosynthesis
VDVTVVCGTFGDPSWSSLAQRRALPSAQALGVPTVHVHAGALHEARNAALARVETEWVVHLDADDELEPGYLAAMERAAADVRAPAVRYVTGKHRPRPTMPRVAGHAHACASSCLPEGNWLVVGALVRAGMIRSVGGWRDEPVYEDWSVWLRCYLAGATFEAVPGAVYRAHVRRDSRNRGSSPELRLATHRAIAEANGVPVP